MVDLLPCLPDFGTISRLIYCVSKQLDVSTAKSGYLGAQFVNYQAQHSPQQGKVSRRVGSRFFGVAISATTFLKNWELLWGFFCENEINFTTY